MIRRPMQYLIIVLIFLWLPATLHAQESEEALNDPWQAVSCDTFDIPADITADCGYVTVPEFYDQDNGRTVSVAVVRVKSSGQTPVADPLIVTQGGPGGSSIQFVALLSYPTSSLTHVLRHRDVVFIEQRGTFYSQPFLHCPEMTEAEIIDLETAGAEFASEIAAFAACRQRFEADGINLSAFDSMESANDIITVVDALGYDQINFYGVSYGTLLGQFALRQHPDRFRAVIFDAVVPTDINVIRHTNYAASYALRQLFETCAADAICGSRYPDLETIFFQLVDRLNQAPLSIPLELSDGQPLTASVNGDDLLVTVFRLMYSRFRVVDLPQQIHQAFHNGNYEWLKEALPTSSMNATFARGLQAAVNCAQFNYPDVLYNFELDPYPHMHIFVQNYHMLAQICADYTVDPLPAEAYTIPNGADIPVMIMSGQYDPITPRYYGEYLGSKFQQAYVYTYPGMGHGTFLASAPCPGLMAADFLDDPTQPPYNGCLQDITPQFTANATTVDALTLARTEVLPGVWTVIPEQWYKNEYGVYVDRGAPTESAGYLRFFMVDALTREQLVEELGSDASLDVATGPYEWSVYEEVTAEANLRRYALTTAEEHSYLVVLMAPPYHAEAAFEKLWLPILENFEVIQ